MYKAEHNKNGSLKHSNQCTAAFGRKDKECPRCVEMLQGAPARSGWQKDYYENKKREQLEEAALIQEIRTHKCTDKCGVVCTRFEW